MRERVRALLSVLPSALLLAVLTGVVTLGLAILLSVVLGGESRRIQHQTMANAAEIVDHAIVSRCQMAHIVDMLKEIGDQAPSLDLSKFDEINTEGLNCKAILTEPFRPGRDLP